MMYNITTAGSFSGNCDDKDSVRVDDLSLVILSMHKLATCKAGMHDFFCGFVVRQKAKGDGIIHDELSDGQGLKLVSKPC